MGSEGAQAHSEGEGGSGEPEKKVDGRVRTHRGGVRESRERERGMTGLRRSREKARVRGGEGGERKEERDSEEI